MSERLRRAIDGHRSDMARTTDAQRTTRTNRAPQLRYVRTFDCAAGRLWNLITKPELLSTWLGPVALSDTEHGGFTVVTGPQTQETGIVATCEPPHYFQASFDNPGHQPSTVLVDVVPAVRGTHFILTHGGIRNGQIHHFDLFWTAGLERLRQQAALR
ncbi:SRPBCC domain-containing protein [Kribbella sp. HUAS MG21]|uniref:SRPBCC domain-containing protein n=1 Tax=Kribbella sp. HUAS MG21 TaxID=3160966 RepID=A0AAU7T788_9ACTN